MKYNTKLTFYIVITVLISTLFSCKSDIEEIPMVYVNFQIDILNDPEFIDLSAVGNYVYVTGGYKGIIIYRRSLEEFVALERACPNDPHNEFVSVDESGVLAIDTVCGSKFSLLLDGAVVEGPATYPLKNYDASFNSASNILYVFN